MGIVWVLPNFWFTVGKSRFLWREPVVYLHYPLVLQCLGRKEGIWGKTPLPFVFGRPVGFGLLWFGWRCIMASPQWHRAFGCLPGLLGGRWEKGRFNSYCWWLKSQTTTWDVWNPINNGINYQPQPVSRISAINGRLSWAVLHVTFNHQVRFVDSCYTVIWFGYIQLFDVQVRFLFDVSYLYYIMTLVYLYYLSEPINLNIHDVFFDLMFTSL